MGKTEQRLFDLEEYLRRNDDSADSSAYLTIIGIANDVSELESENAKLRELVHTLAFCTNDSAKCDECPMNVNERCPIEQTFCDRMADRLREIGIEVNDG